MGNELRTVFAMAKEEAPSILLLEDLNLYVESNSPYAPEWACLQACIDDAKDTDLFVIATTNDTRYMPPSLLRPGRFDYVIYLQPPIGENAENIVSYYLRDKDLAEDVLISDIVKAMPKVSCATLETVMNLAALNSVYQGHEHIQKEDITEALLQVVYKLQKTDKETDSTELQKIAVHEAAHAVVGEVLHPGSIGIVTVRGNQGVIGGMANGCATYAQNEEEFLDEVTKTLAGRAGVSLIYGVMDIQASADIEQADKLMDIWQCHFAGGGFVGIESGDNRMSEQRLSYNEAIKSAKLEELYRRACYFHDQQYEDAQKYLDQYEKAGGVLAYEMLGLMQQYIQKKGKTALTYYEKAVKNKFYYAYVLMGDLYSYGEQDMWVRLSLEISSCDCVVKRIDSYKKAVEHNQAEGAHKMAENTEGTVERAYWTKVAEKQGYKNGMKSWTSDIAEFNK